MHRSSKEYCQERTVLKYNLLSADAVNIKYSAPKKRRRNSHADQKLRTRTEDVEPWQPLGCINCTKPAVDQETAFLGDKRLPVSIRNCGENSCKEYATAEALRIAAYPEVQEKAM